MLETAEQYIQTRSLGCFVDSRNRAMPVDIGGRHNTIQTCAEAAKSRGYKYFGLQYGGMCYTGPGHTYDSQGKARDSECRNGLGGSWRSNVYEIVNSGGSNNRPSPRYSPPSNNGA